MNPDVPAAIEAPAFAPSGVRTDAVGGGDRIGASGAAVVGTTGGTTLAGVSVRARLAEDYVVAVALPFAAYRSLDGRETGLGDLRVGVDRVWITGTGAFAVGFELGVGTGNQAYTWVNRADEVWPGGGVTAYARVARRLGDATAVVAQGWAGVHLTPGYDPLPPAYTQVGAAAAIDRSVAGPLGVIGEATLATWEVSPGTVSALVRVDPLPATRLRAGATLPWLTWAGASPTTPGGVGEVTLLADLQLAL